ncbi:Sulfoacetaldehyde reductase [Aquicella siphonis]|uniref:Sulfoacetaldehyde reductase n=1 Tax=Aquicella siphonis TaxID=254247 RepID=A0A5E4PFG0_9COXI|nr:SDR family oxidoreductase [Aquicella siphonis]VVC75720.1 Sulfoacetaldehyde reductase [Aquicella siphonis]
MEKIALITGATRGIGKALAEIFARHGYSLILIARNAEELRQIQADLQTRFQCQSRILSADLAKADSITLIMETFRDEMNQVDVLINNAGFGFAKSFTDISLEDTTAMLDVNVSALTRLSHAVLPYMQARRRGHVLNVASTAAYAPGPYMAVYYASKAYVLSFSEALYEEYKNAGVSISVLCPGVTRTSFQERAGMQDTLMVSGMLPVMTAEKVAQLAYKGMIKKQRLIIPGVMNKLLVLSMRLSPGWLSAKITGWLDKPKDISK